MRTEYLEYLLEVARTSSISAAAKNLFMGQTTLSAIVNSIENELNVKIFIRTHRGVKLTERGEEIVALAEGIVEQTHRLIELNSNTVTAQRNIPLVAYPSACSSVGLYLNSMMNEIKGEPSLSIYESLSGKVVSKVIDGTSNIGIGASGRNELFNHQYTAHNHGLHFEPIYTDHFCLCVRSDSPLAGKGIVDISELENEHLAVTEAHSASSTISVGGVFRFVRRVSVLNNAEVIKKVVLAENMIAVMPRLSFYKDPLVASGNLQLLEITGFETELRNFLISNQSTINTYEQQVIRLIRNFYAELSDG